MFSRAFMLQCMAIQTACNPLLFCRYCSQGYITDAKTIFKPIILPARVPLAITFPLSALLSIFEILFSQVYISFRLAMFSGSYGVSVR